MNRACLVMVLVGVGGASMAFEKDLGRADLAHLSGFNLVSDLAVGEMAFVELTALFWDGTELGVDTTSETIAIENPTKWDAVFAIEIERVPENSFIARILPYGQEPGGSFVYDGVQTRQSPEAAIARFILNSPACSDLVSRHADAKPLPIETINEFRSLKALLLDGLTKQRGELP